LHDEKSAALNRTEREFDLILWGATGFTGQLVAGYLYEQYGLDSFRWAIGGRSEARLAAVRDHLDAPELSIVLGDSDDDETMRSLAERTRVVCSTVGPYARYGSRLVAACAGAGTDYCDLTGELHWIRYMLDAHHSQAKASGARIVPSCGFDSIPSDLGVFFLQREMRARHGAPSPHVKCGVAGFSGGFSGGTIASILNIMEEAEADRSVRRILANPYAINPKEYHRGPDVKDRMSPAYDTEFGQWTAPFLMAGVNTRVVRRSAALLSTVYGPGFRYEESMLTGRHLTGWMRALGVAAGMTVVMGAMIIGPVRRLVTRWLPQPGDGPTPEEQKNGYWNFRFFARPPKVPGARPLRARLKGDRDPGYGSTSKMLAESAVCLALDPMEAGGGFHTPASAMGEALIDRLQKHAGVTFELMP
jgi:short subunit dehydrogenase-like uncharacterized protein